MKFCVNKLILWINNSKRTRVLEFKRNKVNVITGESGTGKTAILDIFDYCFLSSDHNISESVINESVSWYGLDFNIKNKRYFLARRAPRGSKVSKNYYFSSVGEVPSSPAANIDESDLRQILEVEFGVDGSTKTPFGGRAIKAGSKLSFRYFFLFNTISEDIITNSTVFFDKQSKERYREALPRIFDLALGIDTVENILAREKRDRLEAELTRLERKRQALSSKKLTFVQEASDKAKQAAAYGLISEADLEDPVGALRVAVERGTEGGKPGWKGKYDEISGQLLEINKKIRNAYRFSHEYSQYKSSLSDADDSLRPIDFIVNNSDEVIKTEKFDELIGVLRDDLQQIKVTISKKSPVDIQIRELLQGYFSEQERLKRLLDSLPQKPESLGSEREKWIFVGEMKERLATVEGFGSITAEDSDGEIERLRGQIENISIDDVVERRSLAIRTIENNAQSFLDSVSSALDNYAGYQSVFNYQEKRLQLRHPNSLSIERVGSSSNHMFLHLALFLALHELSLMTESPFIPQFLVIDQPSRPYYGDEPEKTRALSKSDTSKIKTAILGLDEFIGKVINQYKEDFQMIG